MWYAHFSYQLTFQKKLILCGSVIDLFFNVKIRNISPKRLLSLSSSFTCRSNFSKSCLASLALCSACIYQDGSSNCFFKLITSLPCSFQRSHLSADLSSFSNVSPLREPTDSTFPSTASSLSVSESRLSIKPVVVWRFSTFFGLHPT